jgi:hypothetical protein
MGGTPNTRLTWNLKSLTRVSLSEAPVRDDEWSYSMTRSKLLGVTATMSIAIATPVFAQAVVQEPGAYALALPKVGAVIGTALSQRRDVRIVNHGTADAMPSTPSVRLWRAGNETATRPWSAPVGHHQPTAAGVLESDSQQTLDQEDANVDRIVRGICRGC